jgi:hypothetical protein
MPLEFIKNWIYTKELNKKIVSAKSSNHIGVFINYPTHIEELALIKKYFMSKGSKADEIQLLAYIPQNEVSKSECAFYCLKDIKWAGFPKAISIDDFLKNRFKKFYYLCTTFEEHQRFVLSKVQADFKAGVSHRGIEKYLDFILDAPLKSLDQSLLEINHTIDKITKK